MLWIIYQVISALFRGFPRLHILIVPSRIATIYQYTYIRTSPRIADIWYEPCSNSTIPTYKPDCTLTLCAMAAGRDAPAGWDAPPPGYKPGQTRAPLILDIAVPLGVIAIFLACLRLYVRVCLVRVVGKDDWLLLAAVIFLCGILGGVTWQTTLGLGKHQYELNQSIDRTRLTQVCYSFFYMLFISFSIPCREMFSVSYTCLVIKMVLTCRIL